VRLSFNQQSWRDNEETIMKCKAMSSILLTTLCLLGSAAWASTTWYVNGVSGSDSNNCMSLSTACKTIGHSISLAISGDSILVAAATYTENLTISINLKVIGSGASTTIVDGSGAALPVFFFPSTTTNVTLSKLTIRNAVGLSLGVANNGTLTINNSTISGNRSLYGGGISNHGTLKINSSTISGNVAFRFCITRNNCHGGVGGGIDNAGALTINNSTLSGNSAAVSGGGISGTAILQNSIIANSLSGGNCNAVPTSHGYNLSSDGACVFNGPGDLNNTDPKLGPLQNNGGPTQTQALLSGSPAIDAGNPSGCTDGNGHLLKTDQRGQPRPDKEDTGGCDMGAYESQRD
jgi:hypothetical protein